MKYSEIKQITLLHRRLGKGKVWNDDGTFDGDWWADVPFGDDELNIALTWEGEFMPERVAFINYHLDIIAERDAARAALKPFADEWTELLKQHPEIADTDSIGPMIDTEHFKDAAALGTAQEEHNEV